MTLNAVHPRLVAMPQPDRLSLVVVEDDAEVRKALSRLLQSLGRDEDPNRARVHGTHALESGLSTTRWGVA